MGKSPFFSKCEVSYQMQLFQLYESHCILFNNFYKFTYSVNVIFAVVGVIVVNNELNIVDIQTTGSDICSDQDSCTSGSEY